MPSDFEPISKTECVGCGRDADQVALKRLNTYSRAFGCLACYLKYSNCGNCHHEKHSEDRQIALRLKDIGGKCWCGCRDYTHGLEAEFDRQFAVHTGKAPTTRLCLRGCGSLVTVLPNGRLPLFCQRCDQEWAELGNG